MIDIKTDFDRNIKDCFLFKVIAMRQPVVNSKHNAEIVILANSIKFGKHCVAGKLVGTQHWIRLVSNKQGSELDDGHVLVCNPYGAYPVKVLQKVYVKILSEEPLINQPENCLIDTNVHWRQNFKIDRAELDQYIDNPRFLFWEAGDSLSYTEIQNGNIKINNSLFLVRVRNLRLFTNVFKEKIRRKAEFLYNGIVYNLSVTDPNFDNLYHNQQHYEEAVLCVSLGVPFHVDNCCYKIVATIFI